MMESFFSCLYNMDIRNQIKYITKRKFKQNGRAKALFKGNQFFFQMENVEKMSPAVLANVGILMMTSQDVGWKMMLVQWLEKCDEADKELMTGFCDIYIEKTIDYLSKCCQPHMFGNNDTKGCPRYKRVINHSVENMVSTFTTLLDVSILMFFAMDYQ